MLGSVRIKQFDQVSTTTWVIIQQKSIEYGLGSIFNWGPNLSYTGVEFKIKVIYNCISDNLDKTL